LALQYAEILAKQGIEWGLIGPKESDRIWERHIENCLPVTTLIPKKQRKLTLADVGSGAGLPGIVISLARPDLAVTLIEPIPRRATFLNQTITRLRLNEKGERISVLQAKVEGAKGSFDFVTARAVAPLSRLIPQCWHLIKPGGSLLAIKGASVEHEIAELDLPSGAKLTLHEINLEDLPTGRVVEVVKAG